MSETQFCPFCQRKNSSDATHCAYCGVSLSRKSKLEQFLTTNNVNVQGVEPLPPQRTTDCTNLREQMPENTIAFIVEDVEKPVLASTLTAIVLGRGDESKPIDSELVDLSKLGDMALAVSRQHARLDLDESGWSLTDLNSTNGTWLNNKRLPPDTPHLLQSGDQIWLGPLRLIFCAGAGSPAESPVAAGAAPVVDDQIPLLLRQVGANQVGSFSLTPAQLHETIGPYLEAIERLQQLLNELRQEGSAPVQIVSVQAGADGILVELANAATAVDVLNNWIKPWRSRYLQEMAKSQETMSLEGQIFSLAHEIVARMAPQQPKQAASRAAREVATELQILTASSVQLQDSK